MAWITFTPTQFGGRAVYLIISGTSMEPTFYTGDLVILHRANTYQAGDIAAYFHPVADGIVIHRVVGEEDGRFILLGDNKPEIDPYRPTVTDMVGKFWLRIPAVGNIVTQLKSLGFLSPIVLAIVLIILLIPPLIVGQTKSKKRHHSRSVKKVQTQMNQLDSTNKTDLIFFLVVMALASAVLAFFGFKQPLTKTVSDDLSYEQHGAFSYSASAPPGIYNSDEVQTGAPIFRELINQITINFDYQLVSALPTDVAGSYRLVADLGHANGWQKSIELVPETSFKGGAFNIGTAIDLSEFQSLLDNLEQQTGLRGQRYTLAIKPEVSVKGTLNGNLLADQFSPSLTFELDETQLQLVASDSNQFKTTQGDLLNPSQTGTVIRKIEAPTVLSLLGFSLAVSTIRQIAVLGLIISLGGLLVFGWFVLRLQQADEASQIQFKHGSLLINIKESGLTIDKEVIEVATIDDLVQVAERTGGMILHYAHGSRHQYLVKDEAMTYRYQSQNQPTTSRLPVPERAPRL
jgi:signal peptidase I